MHRDAPVLAALALALSGCASSGGPFPSLQPRPAEAIDPRVAVVRPTNERPVSASLASRLSALVEQARSGDATFAPVIAQAEQLASAAGDPQSESWISAQQALTAAIAARSPTATALGDIDALAATMLQTQTGLAPNDLAAIQHAQAVVGAIDQRQADRVSAVQQRLRA